MLLRTLLACALVCTACGDDDAMMMTIDDAGPLESDAALTVDDAGPITEEDAGPSTTSDTWENFAMEWFATYCTECHQGGRRDYRTIDEVIRDQDRIKCGVSPVMEDGCRGGPNPRQFPIGMGARPGDESRQRLIDWINAGLPE